MIFEIFLSVGLATAINLSAGDVVQDIASLNLKKKDYDGQHIHVRGYVVVGSESMYIVQKLGYQDDFWAKDSGCLSLLSTGKLGFMEDRYNGKYAEVEGQFRADNDSYGISMSECGVTGIDIDADAPGQIKRLSPPVLEK